MSSISPPLAYDAGSDSMIRIERKDAHVGDVVRLKSGSPEMTILGREDQEILCGWFDGDKWKDLILHINTVEKVR